ncbi:cardiolipin synthase ClsB [Aquabacterium fontiphilum]|jgi:cardiolipin synthase|uniref:cardiolipin synthase ClsB n=1 Tax=Aquabacterium fontiphilum TaxID=450365 RepID=UPI001F02D3F6|nr:cardiolipin synthase ClsB [Aquabacterium fontiphilum]
MQRHAASLQHDDELTQLAWYAQRRPLYTGGNTVELLRGGQTLFPAMRDRIDQAQHSVWVAFYIVHPQGQAGMVLQALKRAARRGVNVHMVVDGVGSRDAPETVWRELMQAGVQLEVYRPLHRVWGLLDASQWRRLHMKLCTVDDEAAFIGGINLIDDCFDLHHGWTELPRLDYAVAVSGPVVTPVVHTIRAMWTRARFGRDWRDDLSQWARDPHRLRNLRHLWQHARLRLTPREQGQLRQAPPPYSPMRAAFVLRDNLRQRRTIERAALQAMQQARQRIDIVTPYFYPRRAIRIALRQAAARGVQVRLLLQGKLDYRIAGIAARVLYAELQRHGVRIHEYQPAFLHAKILAVDDEWATIGSSNLDPLSLVLNLEANLIVRDRGFSQALGQALEQDFANSREVLQDPAGTPTTWGRRLERAAVGWLAKAYLWLAGATGRY